MPISREIRTDKAGMLEFLAEQKAAQDKTAQDPSLTLRERIRARGYSAGLEYAMAAVRDWTEVKDDEGQDEDLHGT